MVSLEGIRIRDIPAFNSLFDIYLLGIGDMILVKSIVQSTGRSMTSIKNDLDKCGDLGIVAEESRGSQQIMFKPSPLTLRAVFKKLREIADLKGLYAIMYSKITNNYCK